MVFILYMFWDRWELQISSGKKCDACSMEDSVDLCKMTRSEILCAKAAKILTLPFGLLGK